MKRGAHLFLLSCVLAWFGEASVPAQTTTTITALSASTNAACLGRAITFTAVVTSDPAGLGIPTGTVAFKDGAVVIGSAPLDAVGQADFATASLGAGSHSITAQYGGDGSFYVSTSSSGSVTVNTAPVVTGYPADTAVCAGGSVSFTAAATGSPAPTIQWQVSTDGGATFQNVAGATSSTYTFAASQGDNAKRYRAEFSNACGVADSVAATLTVNALPVCSISGADGICANSTANLYSAPAGLTAYRWSVTGNATLSGSTVAQPVSVNAGASGSFTLTLTLTNASGCSSTCSKTVTILSKPTAFVSGGGTICSGNGANIQAALSGTGPWTLTWSDGFTQANVAASPATRRCQLLQFRLGQCDRHRE